MIELQHETNYKYVIAKYFIETFHTYYVILSHLGTIDYYQTHSVPGSWRAAAFKSAGRQTPSNSSFPREIGDTVFCCGFCSA